MHSLIVKNDFGELAGCLGKLNIEGRKICIVTDENVAELYYGIVKQALKPLSEQITKYVLKPGEKSKTITAITDIISFLSWKEFAREDFILALGG